MNFTLSRQGFFYAILLFVPFIVDRLTKSLALHFIQSPIAVAPGISLELVKNHGISWGLLNAQAAWQFNVLVLFIVTVICVFMVYTYFCWPRSRPIIGPMLVVSGAISNLVDRFLYGGVIDFIKLSAYGWVWPNFNVADIAIVVGVGILLYQSWATA